MIHALGSFANFGSLRAMIGTLIFQVPGRAASLILGDVRHGRKCWFNWKGQRTKQFPVDREFVYEVTLK